MRAIYISGPMTDRPEHNYPAFYAAEERWRAMGWDVLNPARNFGGRTDLDRATYMRADVHHLLKADAIALLEDWVDSPGAKVELALARELGLEIFDGETGLPLDAHADITGWEFRGH